jgi:gluconolactonase
MNDAKPPLTFESRTTALIVQDLQNDVVSDGGGLAHTGSAEHARSQNVVANVQRLADACRRAGAAVIHVWHLVPEGAAKLNAPLFQAVKDNSVAVKGTWGSAPADGLEPQAGDFVVEKLRMNAFHDTTLESVLRGLGVETIVVSGAFTNMSVEHTARHGADAGYRVVVPSDGTSSMNEEWHQAALRYALTQVATIATCQEIVDALATSPPSEG